MKSQLLVISFVCLVSGFASADEISKKLCQNFLPAFSDNNILIYNNTVKNEFAKYPNPKFQEKYNTYIKAIEADVGLKAQANCDNSKYPIMDLQGCYNKCRDDGYKTLPDGLFGWNVNEASYRRTFISHCQDACAGAYSAQNTIASVLNRVETSSTSCANSSVQVMDNKMLKPVNQIMQESSKLLDGSSINLPK